MATRHKPAVEANYFLIDIDCILGDTPDADDQLASKLASTLRNNYYHNVATLDVVQVGVHPTQQYAVAYELLHATAEQQTILLAYRMAQAANADVDMVSAFVINARTEQDLHNLKAERCEDNEARIVEQRNLLSKIAQLVQPTEVEVQPNCTLISATPVAIDDAELTLYIIMVEGQLLSRISPNKYNQETLNDTCKYAGVAKFIETGWSKVG